MEKLELIQSNEINSKIRRNEDIQINEEKMDELEFLFQKDKFKNLEKVEKWSEWINWNLIQYLTRKFCLSFRRPSVRRLSSSPSPSPARPKIALLQSFLSLQRYPLPPPGGARQYPRSGYFLVLL